MDCNGNGLFVQEWMTAVFWRRRKLSRKLMAKSPLQLKSDIVLVAFCAKKDLFANINVNIGGGGE